MIIPKVLAQNSGFDPQESIVKLQVMNDMVKMMQPCLVYYRTSIGPVDSSQLVLICPVVKPCCQQMKESGITIVLNASYFTRGMQYHSSLVLHFPLYSTTIASNLLLVDEVMKAGMSSLKG